MLHFFNLFYLCPCVSQCAQSELDAETVKSILAEYKIHNADITLRGDVTADDLIDVVEGNRYMMTGFLVLTDLLFSVHTTKEVV